MLRCARSAAWLIKPSLQIIIRTSPPSAAARLQTLIVAGRGSRFGTTPAPRQKWSGGPAATRPRARSTCPHGCDRRWRRSRPWITLTRQLGGVGCAWFQLRCDPRPPCNRRPWHRRPPSRSQPGIKASHRSPPPRFRCRDRLYPKPPRSLLRCATLTTIGSRNRPWWVKGALRWVKGVRRQARAALRPRIDLLLPFELDCAASCQGQRNGRQESRRSCARRVPRWRGANKSSSMATHSTTWCRRARSRPGFAGTRGRQRRKAARRFRRRVVRRAPPSYRRRPQACVRSTGRCAQRLHCLESWRLQTPRPRTGWTSRVRCPALQTLRSMRHSHGSVAAHSRRGRLGMPASAR